VAYFSLLFAIKAFLGHQTATACGLKAPPLPAESALPERVQDVAYRFSEEERLIITFRPPEKNRRGLPLKDLGGFYVDRAEDQLRPGFCSTCPVSYRRHFQVPATTPPPLKNVAEVTYTVEDRLKPGYSYRYRITAHNRAGEFDPDRATIVTINYDRPGQPPERLEAHAENHIVYLKWSTPGNLIDGRTLVDLAGYDLYRRLPGQGWQKLNIGGPWGQNTYEDIQVDNEHEYEYRVRTVRNLSGTLIDGPASGLVSARPVNLTPPPPPVKVDAALTVNGIRLVWSEVKTPDRAGYRVYKRLEGENRFRKLEPGLILENTFFDEQVKYGQTYYYRVTTVDRTPLGNESPPSPEVRVRYDR
ncbi:MAG: fibronectin type III domain-containing protein, partial [Deltaproteobacteria bacterium]|nr:fibronectin type III domain-containing protein [Deltaproteobacteria bacterium]